mgnify:CR=1 FL=1
MGEKLSVQQVAKKYGMSERTVHKYIFDGLLDAYRVGPKLVRLDADEVEAALVKPRAAKAAE